MRSVWSGVSEFATATTQTEILEPGWGASVPVYEDSGPGKPDHEGEHQSPAGSVKDPFYCYDSGQIDPNEEETKLSRIWSIQAKIGSKNITDVREPEHEVTTPKWHRPGARAGFKCTGTGRRWNQLDNQTQEAKSTSNNITQIPQHNRKYSKI